MKLARPCSFLATAALAVGSVVVIAQVQTAVRPPATGAVESPDGRRTVWVPADGRSVMSATRATRTADWGAPDRLLTIRGAVKNLVFSPDNARLAFENPRTSNGTASTDKWAFIAVYDFATRQVSYVDPSFDLDSWGGYITAEALSRHSDIFTVGFDMAGVHDAPGDRFKFSALGNIDTWQSPVLLAQGDDDRNVNFTEGIKLARALQVKRPNVEFVQRVLPGQTHDLYLTFDQLVGIYMEGSQFLLRHLGVQ